MPTTRYRVPCQHAGAGVRSLWIVCELCHHEAVLNGDGCGDAVVPAFDPRIVCTSCGIIGAFARPNWQERPASESLTGRQCGSEAPRGSRARGEDPDAAFGSIMKVLYECIAYGRGVHARLFMLRSCSVWKSGDHC